MSLTEAIIWVITGMSCMGVLAVYCGEKWYKYRRLYRKYKKKEGYNAIIREVFHMVKADRDSYAARCINHMNEYVELHKKYDKVVELYNELQKEKIIKGEVKYVRR